MKTIKRWREFYSYLETIKEEEIILDPEGTKRRLLIDKEGRKVSEKVKD